MKETRKYIRFDVSRTKREGKADLGNAKVYLHR